MEEELSRTVDIVRALAEEGVCVSIDTRHAEVARACVEAGAAIINDVSGFRDSAMVEVAASCDAGCVIMHMKGEPATMQGNPDVRRCSGRGEGSISPPRQPCLKRPEFPRGRICLDPGPGFRQNPFRPSSSCATSTNSLV